MLDASGLGLTNPEIVFSKLTYGAWQTWPGDEQQVIRTFFRVLWLTVLHGPSGDFNAELANSDTCLCAIVRPKMILRLPEYVAVPADSVRVTRINLVCRV